MRSLSRSVAFAVLILAGWVLLNLTVVVVDAGLGR